MIHYNSKAIGIKVIVSLSNRVTDDFTVKLLNSVAFPHPTIHSEAANSNQNLTYMQLPVATYFATVAVQN